MYVRITDLNQQSKILGFKESGYKINNSPGAVSPKPGSDKVKQQELVIPNKYGERLVGVLHDAESSEIVVLCHGFRSTKDDPSMVNLAVALQNEGISAFRFDFAGNGESEGSFQYGNYWREADDLRAVVQYFCGANHAVGAILGHSKGGSVVLLYASKYNDIRTFVNVSGRYDLKGGIEDRLGKDYMEKIMQDGFIDVKNKTGDVEYRVTEESLMDRLNTNMHDACLQIDMECSVLTIHGSSDKIIPLQDAHEFDKIIPNHKLHVVEGANHGYTNHQAELVSVVLDFVKASLKQDHPDLSEIKLKNECRINCVVTNMYALCDTSE
ncbi:Hydrolase 4 domain-containing protein [Citrus sinensis]|uniref:Hydrolase 4 domain-containing protein n=1 Tax=Citrus sinensis TaxID=2711 RepID=A0ACB8NU89_CITSI|nr:Hydrolase 4 domain-containing protein [Citrus sinensis]